MAVVEAGVPKHFFFLAANSLNYLGVAMLSVSLGWHIYQATANPLHLALIGLMQILPVFLFFFATGWIVDSFSRKKILASCVILDAIVLASISFLMTNETLDLFLLFGCVFVHGTVMAFYFPSSQAIIPNIVSKSNIRRAIALSSTVNNIAQTCGLIHSIGMGSLLCLSSSGMKVRAKALPQSSPCSLMVRLIIDLIVEKLRLTDAIDNPLSNIASRRAAASEDE
jgi:MFS family permease